MLDSIIDDACSIWQQKDCHQVSYVDTGRIQDGWKVSESIKKLATLTSVLQVLQQLYQHAPLPFQTLNFAKGTQQKVHSDSIHFNCEPFGLMCGVWVALEDVGQDQGPLIYYPGSQYLPEMNYDYFGLKKGCENYKHYENAIEQLIQQKQFQPEYGLLKKGQALIWSTNLLHGGSMQNNLNLTRHSQVTHYYFDQCKYWRPILVIREDTTLNQSGYLMKVAQDIIINGRLGVWLYSIEF